MTTILTEAAPVILGGLLREIRIRANVTQKQLADNLQIPQSTISKMETGERGVEVLELMRICAALDVSFADFVSRLQKTLIETGESD